MQKTDSADGKITDEGIAFMRSHIGLKRPVPSWHREVTRDGIEHFALGIGDDNPLWWDEDYAASSPWGGRVAPPCYLYSHTRAPRLKPEHGGQSVEIYLPGVLGIWSGETWRWSRLPRAGDVINGQVELIEVTEGESRFGGRAVTQVERITLATPEGEVVAEIDNVHKRYERSQTRARKAYDERPLATYTAEDRAGFARQYEAEREARRGGDPRYLEDIRVGETLGPMLKGPLTITNVVGFLLGGGCNLAPTNRMLHTFEKLHPDTVMIHPDNGVTDTIQAPHYDAVLAQLSGMPAPFDFGCMRISWFAHLLTDWAGDHGFVCEMQTRILRPNLMGDVTWLTGEVTAIDEAASQVSIQLSGRNQLDETTMTGSAKVRLPHKPS